MAGSGYVLRKLNKFHYDDFLPSFEIEGMQAYVEIKNSRKNCHWNEL